MKPFDTLVLRVGGSSKSTLLASLRRRGIQLNAYAEDLFDRPGFSTSPTEREVHLEVVSLPELGLPDGAPYDPIVRQAAEHGLSPCALEVAPHLRLHLLDQLEGPYLTVASPRLQNSPGAPNGLYLRRLPDGLWLRGYRADADYHYAPDFSDWVFERIGP